MYMFAPGTANPFTLCTVQKCVSLLMIVVSESCTISPSLPPPSLPPNSLPLPFLLHSSSLPLPFLLPSLILSRPRRSRIRRKRTAPERTHYSDDGYTSDPGILREEPRDLHDHDEVSVRSWRREMIAVKEEVCAAGGVVS